MDELTLRYCIFTLCIIIIIICLFTQTTRESMTNKLVTYDSVIPKGTIVAWAPPNVSLKPPYGWAICDGTNNTPDLRGKFLVGTNEGMTILPTGQISLPYLSSGGEASHQLTIDELPNHKHNPAVILNTNMEYGNCLGDSNSMYSGKGGDNFGSSTTFSSGCFTSGYVAEKLNTLTGAIQPDQAHNNMPPYYTIIYIIKL